MDGIHEKLHADISRIILVFILLLFSCNLVTAEDVTGSRNNNWYEIFVRSFQDSNGDGIGDLNGVISRLDYLQDMGYNGIWLMPVMPSPSYHKYDVTDYMSIDPEYGTLADMQRLVNDVHTRGMNVIIDLVLNHTSLDHPWFAEAMGSFYSEKPGIYRNYYEFTQTASSKTIPIGETGWYYEEQFSGGGMPDLNLADGDVRQQIRIIMDFWLNVIGVDGFRLDAVTSYFAGDHARNVSFLSWMKNECNDLKPGCYLVGECWEGIGTIADYYASGVDSFFLFPASQAEGFIVSSLRGRSGRAEKFASRYGNVLEQIPDGILAPFLSNHDTGRTIGSVQGRQNLPVAKFAEGVMNMMQGNVFTYYGEEIGMVGSGADPNKRLAMYWSDGDMTEQPPGVTAIEYAYPSVEVQMDDPDSLLNYCRLVNHARTDHPMIANGQNEFLLAEGDILLMRRTLNDESCLIAMNFSPKSAGECRIPADSMISADIETGADKAEIVDGMLVLPPYSIVILR